MLGSKWLLYKAENSIGGGTNHKKVAQKTEKRKKREIVKYQLRVSLKL